MQRGTVFVNVCPAWRCLAAGGRGVVLARTQVAHCHQWKPLRGLCRWVRGCREWVPWVHGGLWPGGSAGIALCRWRGRPVRPAPPAGARCRGPASPCPGGRARREGGRARRREGGRKEGGRGGGMERRREGRAGEADTLPAVAPRFPLALSRPAPALPPVPPGREARPGAPPDTSLFPQARAGAPRSPSGRRAKRPGGSPGLSRRDRPRAPLRPPSGGVCSCRRGPRGAHGRGPRSLLGIIKSNRRASPRSRGPPAPPGPPGPRGSAPVPSQGRSPAGLSAGAARGGGSRG